VGDVVNLNRFRKKKAREDKARQAETNRRLHGRTKEERARDEAQKRRLKDKLDGVFLVREEVRMEDIPTREALDALEAAADAAIPIEDLNPKLPPALARDDESTKSSD
jgi:hypothetical protein